LRRKLVFVGIILLIIGIVALIFSLWQIPFQEQEAYDVPQSSVVLHETFIVPGDGETVRPINLTIWDQLHIYFSNWGLGYGHYGAINFLILDENNYLDREAGEPYDKLVYLSQAARYNQYCLITHDGTWYFVWDNTFKSSRDAQLFPVEVSTTITRNWNETAYRDITVYHTVVPSAYSTHVEYGGIALSVASVVIIIWGLVQRKKTKL
jgi:hypothetical protein